MNLDDVCRALRECEEARGKATKGPWMTFRNPPNDQWHPDTTIGVADPNDARRVADTTIFDTTRGICDAEFIVLSRNLPVDLAKVAELIEKAAIACNGYVIRMSDDDPCKGSMNHLADALSALLSDGRE